MEPKVELAAQVLRRIFENSGAYSDKQVQEIVFHLTDWIEDLVPFTEFLAAPEEYEDEVAMKIIIKFLAHAPDHLRVAAEQVLAPE